LTPVYFDIVSRIVGMEAEAGKIVEQATSAGTKAGTGFADAFKKKVLGTSSDMTASMTTQVNAATGALESASVRVVKAKDAEADAAGRARVAESQLNDARTKYATDSTKFIAAEEKLEAAKRKQIAASADVVTAAASEQRAQENLSKRQDEVAAKAGTLGSAMKLAAVTGVGAMGLAMGEAVKSAADFQTSQTRLVTTAGLSKDALAATSKGILDLAGQVGDSAQDLSTAMYTVSSGMTHVADPTKDAANALGILKASAQGAAQEGAPLKEVVDAVTGSLKDYEKPISEASNVTSEMITAVAHGKTTFGDLTGALGQVEAQAATAKVPFDDLLASVAQLTIHNISAEQGAQNLNAAIRTLQKPSFDATNALSNMGISAAQLGDDLKNKGISGTMEEISRAIMDHIGPSGKVMVSALNQSKVAVDDVTKAYDALPPKLKAVADQVKAGAIAPTVGKLESAGGLDLDQAHMVSQWATMQAKSTGLNSNLTSLKNSNQSYQQMMQTVMGNQETTRVADMLTGEQNQKDIGVTKRAEGDAKTDPAGNVAGWAEVQGNFNQKLAETKAGIGSMAIAIGTDLLPAATKMVDWLKDGATWLQQHKSLTEDVIKGVVGLGAAWVAWKVAGTTFSLVKAGISGIGSAIGGIKTAASTVGSAWSALSSGASTAAGVVKDYWNWTGKFKVQAAADFVATKASAVAEATSTAAAWAGSQVSAGAGWAAMQAKAVGAFVATKASAAATAVETGALWVAQNARVVASFVLVEGAAIAAGVAQKGMAAATWLLNAAMDANPIGLVIAGLTLLVGAVIYAWDHFSWFRDGLKAVWHFIWDDLIKPAIDGIVSYYKMWFDIGVWLYDHGIKPMVSGISSSLTTVKDAFKDAVTWIGDQWGTVEKIVGTPAVAIIDLVYNDGIVKLWNGIADVFSLGKLNPVDTSKIPHYALGGVHGVMPGYSPGVDNHVIAVGGGEAIMRPEWTRAVGPGYVHAANAAARSGGASAVQQLGVPHYDQGGIVGDIVGFAKGVVGDVVDVAKFTAKLVSDPAAAVKDLFAPVTAQAAHTPDGGSDQGTSQWRDMLIGIPANVITSVIDKAKSWLAGGGGSANAPGTPFVGSPDLDGWITQAIALTGVDASVWTPRLKTLIGRESGGNPNAINNYDSNAAAGDPSRGLMQTIGTTFEKYRSKTLPDNIYDPVANIVAGIGYITSTYGDITNVQQGDASKPAKGYATGGVVPGAAGVTSTQKAASGPEQALAQIRDHAATMYAWGGADLATGVDCTGLIGDAMQIAEGITNPTARVGDTTSMLAGQWPHLLSGASTSDIFAVGANKDHAAGTILGTNFEARQTGERIRIGSDAVSAWDPQFTAQWHLDPSVFNPAYTASTTASKKTNAERAQALDASANKALDAAKASDAAAVKHDQTAAKYEDDARKAQALADKTQGAARDKHLHAVQDYKDKAAAAHAAAEKARQEADAHRKKAADDQAKAKTTAATPDATTKNGTSSTSSSSSTTGGLMTFEQAGEKAGGIAASGILETFGLSDTLLADPNKSPLLKVAGQLGNLKIQGQPVFVSPLQHLGQQPAQNIPLVTAAPQATAIPEQLQVTTDDQLSDDLAATHDLGGLLPPGLSIVNNRLGRGEIMVSPQDQLRPAEQPRSAPGDSRPSGPLLHIENWHQHTGGGQEDARAITRELNIFAGMQPR
jgi:hypothetical protein